METGFFGTNPDEARLNNALDLLLDCLLQPKSAGEQQTQAEAELPDTNEAPYSEPEIVSSEAVRPVGRSSNASKSERRKRRPPPDLSS